MPSSKSVKQWFTYAIRDLRAAKDLRTLGPDYKNHVAFNCQQCVEKAIKGFLIAHEKRAPKTHSIKDLAKMVAEIDQPLGKELAKAQRLTKFAVAYRYPDAETKPLTAKQVDSAIKLAQRIFDQLLALSEKE